MHKNFKTNKMTIETMMTCSQKCQLSCKCSCECKDTVNNYGIQVGIYNSIVSTPTDLLAWGAAVG